ncbi:hypothetical protein GGS20DRAFT_356000 [Poronia punctata]|nr:hypothetical protein GGS20DRAFT_356000 [Poronia punctata]
MSAIPTTSESEQPCAQENRVTFTDLMLDLKRSVSSNTFGATFWKQLGAIVSSHADAIVAGQMPACKLRWLLYKNMANDISPGAVPSSVNLFEDDDQLIGKQIVEWGSILEYAIKSRRQRTVIRGMWTIADTPTVAAASSIAKLRTIPFSPEQLRRLGCTLRLPAEHPKRMIVLCLEDAVKRHSGDPEALGDFLQERIPDDPSELTREMRKRKRPASPEQGPEQQKPKVVHGNSPQQAECVPDARPRRGRRQPANRDSKPPTFLVPSPPVSIEVPRNPFLIVPLIIWPDMKGKDSPATKEVTPKEQLLGDSDHSSDEDYIPPPPCEDDGGTSKKRKRTLQQEESRRSKQARRNARRKARKREAKEAEKMAVSV